MTYEYYTYLHCKPDGVPFYVGKGHGKRAYKLRQRNYKHKEIIDCYGEENILIYVFMCESEEQSLHDERQQIKSLKLAGYELVNLTSGGQGPSGFRHTEESKKFISGLHKGRKHTKEAKANMSKAHIGRKCTQETRIKLSNAQRGNKKWQGKSHSEESKKLMSERQKAQWSNPEIRAKKNAAQFGRVVTDETRKKISEALKKRNAIIKAQLK